MGWREKLFGTGTIRDGAPDTTEQIGNAAESLSATLRGKPQPPPRLCSEGHPVPVGSNMCGHGHFVGRA